MEQMLGGSANRQKVSQHFQNRIKLLYNTKFSFTHYLSSYRPCTHRFELLKV